MNTVNRGGIVGQVEVERKQMMRNATKYVPILLRCCFCCVSPSPVRVSLEEDIFRVLVIRHVHFCKLCQLLFTLMVSIGCDGKYSVTFTVATPPKSLQWFQHSQYCPVIRIDETFLELASVCICIFITRIIILQFSYPIHFYSYLLAFNAKRDKVQSFECMNTCNRNAQSKQNSSKIESKLLFSYSQVSIGLTLVGGEGDAFRNEKTSPVEIYANNKLMLSQ